MNVGEKRHLMHMSVEKLFEDSQVLDTQSSVIMDSPREQSPKTAEENVTKSKTSPLMARRSLTPSKSPLTVDTTHTLSMADRSATPPPAAVKSSGLPQSAR